MRKPQSASDLLNEVGHLGVAWASVSVALDRIQTAAESNDRLEGVSRDAERLVGSLKVEYDRAASQARHHADANRAIDAKLDLLTS